MKEKILKALMEHEDRYISGGAFCKELGVSRTSVWKAISSLRADGYNIEACTNRGYRLLKITDNLDINGITIRLPRHTMWQDIRVLLKTDSTNSNLKNAAVNGASEGTVVIAEQQTQGRGRLGRQWLSPSGGGLYMSVLLKPYIKPESIPMIGLAIAVAVKNAIKSVANIECGLKWPNDIIINNKKVCGILSEMVGEVDAISCYIAGIGINVNTPVKALGEALEETAVSIFAITGKRINRNILAAAVLNNIELEYKGLGENTLKSYRDACITLGKNITVIRGDESFSAKALDIAADGALIIQREQGDIESVYSGEVSVRGVMGYC